MRKGPGALSGAMQWPLGLVGGGARSPIPFGARLLPADLQDGFLPSLAGPASAFLPVASQGAFRGGSRALAESRSSTFRLFSPDGCDSTQPTCATVLCLTQRAGDGGDFLLNFDVSASPCLAADDAAHDYAQAFHAKQHGAFDVRPSEQVFQKPGEVYRARV